MTVPVRVFFRLEQDDDDYPPVATESLWAIPGPDADEYIIDNIPFFVHEATIGDAIVARQEDGLPWFNKLLRRSKNSLLRAVFFDDARVDEVRRRLIDIGCSVEYAKDYKLLAISIPEAVRLTEVQDYLSSEATAGTLDYEEPILRQ